MSDFSERLRQLRKAKGATIEQMLELLDVKRRVYFYYESGEREPNIEKLITLADYFDVSLDELVGRSHIDSKGQ